VKFGKSVNCAWPKFVAKGHDFYQYLTVCQWADARYIKNP